jgi:serine/threonine-protein kinase
MAVFNNDGLPGALEGRADIVYVAPILTPTDLQPILSEYENCGALTLVDPPAAGYGAQDQVLILGKVADVGTRATLSDALVAAIGDRDLLLNVDVLNPTLCLVDAVLPNAPQGGFDVTFRMGADGSENQTGRYFVGENPVIDVTLPENVTNGYLFVSALDVSGNVFHLLPNLLMENNAIADLRAGRDGPVVVRLAHALSDAADGSKLAFTVDDTALGKTKIIVIHSDEQMFAGLRPTTESAGGFADALKSYVGAVRSLDSRILETAKP